MTQQFKAGDRVRIRLSAKDETKRLCGWNSTMSHFLGQEVIVESAAHPDRVYAADFYWPSTVLELVSTKDGIRPFDYLTESARTASGHFHGHLVSFGEIEEAFKAFIAAAHALDRIKKLLFYGEDAAKGRLPDRDRLLLDIDAHNAIDSIAQEFDGLSELRQDEKAQFLLHGILGISTEAGEMVEMLYATIFEGEPLDLVNLGEEIGDAQWYEAMLARVLDVTFDQIQRKNIDKLRKRFPDKFTTEAANNRDLDGERAVLERGTSDVLASLVSADEADIARRGLDARTPLTPVQKAE